MSVQFNSWIITLLWISAKIALTGLSVTSETYMSIAVTRSPNKTARRPEEHSAGKHTAPRVVSCKLRTSWLRFRSMTRSLPLSPSPPLARFRSFYGLARAAEDKVHSGKLVDFSFFCGAGRRRRRRTRRSGSGRKEAEGKRGGGAVVRPQEGETFSFQQCPKAHDLSLSPRCAKPRRHFVAFYVPLQLPPANEPSLPAPLPAAGRPPRPAAAVIIIFCSHGAFSPIFPCRRRRLRRRLVRERAGRPTRRRRALSPAPLARTRNSLCCLHIFNTISLAVGRIFGSSQGNAMAKASAQSLKSHDKSVDWVD